MVNTSLAFGEHKVFCGDCINILKKMKSESVDLIITSPPYNCRKNYGEFDDMIPWPEYYEWFGMILDELYRVLCCGGTIAINIPGVVRWQSDHKYADTWSDFDLEYKTHRNGEKVIGKGRIEPVGFKILEMLSQRDRHIREPIVWIKGSDGNAICSDYRMGCDSDPYMRPAHELILLGSKDRWFHRGGTGRRGGDAVPFLEETKDVWFIPPERNSIHPAVFPIELPRRLIRLFAHAPDAVILDPFMGIGTTGMAALEAKKKFIGIELVEKFFFIAANKIKSVVEQIELF